jgi:hypothetical protein
MAEISEPQQLYDSLGVVDKHSLLTTIMENIRAVLPQAYPANRGIFVPGTDAGQSALFLRRNFIEQITQYIPSSLLKAAEELAHTMESTIIATWNYVSELHINQMLRFIEGKMLQISPLEP